MNHYDTLGIERTATDEDVKAAFRKLALQYHPDTIGTEQFADSNLESIKSYQRIQDAYEVLSNDRDRRAYDKQLFPEVDHATENREGSRISSMDVDKMFAEVTTDRVSVAQYNAHRFRVQKGKAFESSKALRTQKLPSPYGLVWLIVIPIAIGTVWSFNVKTARQRG